LLNALKTRWEFQFVAHNIVFERDHLFRGQTNIKGNDLDFELHLVPDFRSSAPVRGQILVTMPGAPEDHEEVVHYVVRQACAQISFPHGRVEVRGGFISAERLPETPEEQKQVGDKPHLVRIRLREIQRNPAFDPMQLSMWRPDSRAAELLHQFNEARKKEDPIDSFLGFFKVIEKAYADQRGVGRLPALIQSRDLLEAFNIVTDNKDGSKRSVDPNTFEGVMRDLVRIRDNCAHLRGKTGYRPFDPRVATEVEPQLPVLAQLARHAVEARCLRSN
jgi:hypothetical protein